jgi:matrixin/thrombospondin type 3 repeat protein
MRLPAFTLLTSLTALATAQAATVPYRTDRELVNLATRIVRARVIDTEAVEEPSGAIRTRTRVAVLEDFTGAADPILTIVEPGGRLPDGRELWIPGAPRYVPGEEVVLCLERGPAGLRTVALAFAAFHVRPDAVAGARLERFSGVAVVGGSRAAVEAPRTLAAFRETVAAAKGVGARAVLSAADAEAHVAAGSRVVESPFTLLGGGFRWREADGDVPIVWYRNVLTPASVQGSDADAELRVALDAWTRPTDARVALAFGGERLDEGPASQAYCTAVNAGAGVITWGDPGNELPVGVLAIGGGCGTSATHVVNNTAFRSFTHGFVIMNDAAALAGYTTVPNVTRILEHEVGHAIGLGHTDGDTSNIMYPSCCHVVTPTPPAIGQDDRAGVVFIYPMPPPSCTWAISPPTASIGALGGEGTATVTTSLPSCSWTASTSVPWIIITDGTSGTGAGIVRYVVMPQFGSSASRTGTIAVTQAPAGVSVVQAADGDNDGDGLSNAWETFFGLDPAVAAGADGAAGDPDGDGVSNADEQTAGSHPRGMVKRYLAEGVSNAFFQTEIALWNPSNPTSAAVLLRVQPENGPEIVWPVTVPGIRLRTVLAPVLRALTGGTPFSTLIESNTDVVVDRTVRWDATGYGAHAETAVEAPSTTWYLAEGSTSGEFALFYLLQNPGDAAASATVRFLRPAPFPAIDRTYTLAPRSRLTIPVDAIGPELANTDVSGVVTATQPIIVERAMYLNRPGVPFVAGHGSAGVTAPATSWFLAEGATGGFFDLFLLIANPSPQAALVQVEYLLPSGGTITKQYAVAAESRFTIYVDDEQVPAGSGVRPLANTSVAARITSMNAVPIIVERAMWWPQPAWYEAHNAAGTTTTGTDWALAAGLAGGPSNAETYVLIANTSSAPGTVWIAVYYDQDALGDTKVIEVPPHSRTSVPMGATFFTAQGRRFATRVFSAGLDPIQIVVERAIYESPGGVMWSAGTAAVATRLSP